MGFPAAMLGMLLQMVNWCSHIHVNDEEEEDFYLPAQAPQVRNDFVPRADIMAANHPEAGYFYPGKRCKPTRDVTADMSIPDKGLELISDSPALCSAGEHELPEEDAIVLVKLETASAVPGAQPGPVKPLTACQQAAGVTHPPATTINEDSQGPATPCQGSSRAVSRTDSSSTAEVQFTADATEACVSITAAAAAPVAAAYNNGPTTVAESVGESSAIKPAAANTPTAVPALTAAPVSATYAAHPDNSAAAVPSSAAGSNSDVSICDDSLSFGIVSEQNSRQYQEDRAAAAVLTGSEMFKKYNRGCFAAVFDGHGGSEAAEHLQQQAVPVLLTQLQLSDDFQAAMQAAPEQLEAQLLAAGCAAGSTMTAALVADNKLFVTNVGDSRAVLCRGGQAVQLTRDHKPSDDFEAANIRAADPSADISSDGYCYGLSVSRALGSCHIKTDAGKKGFRAAADVVVQQLQARDDFVVLGSDGLFDRLRNSEVITTARRLLVAQPGDCTAAARALVERAVQMGSSDNITAVVLLLHGRSLELPKSNSRLFKNRT